MDNITISAIGEAVQFILSISALVGIAVTWRKSGADTISTLQSTVSMLVVDNKKNIEENRRLIKRVENFEKMFSVYAVGINKLVLQIRSFDKVPVWTPSESENYYGQKEENGNLL